MYKIYMCIDLKSFYASIECRERKLDPLNTNLLFTSLIASLTIGGKAIGKKYAINNSNEIVTKFAKILSVCYK